MVLVSAPRAPLPTPTVGADEARRAAEEILRRPEFQPPPRSLYQQALDWLGDRIGHLFGALVDGGAGAVVAWVLLLAVVGAIVYLVVRAWRGDRRRSAAAPTPALEVDPEHGRPAARWDAEAARLEAAGDWRAALRCRYRSLVATLARAGAVDEIPGRTAGEYRTVVGRTRPAVAEPFAGATDLFERAWYGNEPTGPEETSAFRGLAERVASGDSRP